jgi:hypothetical protein
MDWFKCSTRLYQNPKVMLAGEDGVLLYLQLLGLNAQEELDGVLCGPRARPEFLARLMGLLSREWSEARVIAALEALEVAGMIGLGEEGEIAILGWDDSWRPAKSSKERQREFRARKKGDGDAVTQRDDADVTQRNGASVTPSREERYARNGAAVTPSRTQRDTVTPRGEREERGEETRERGASSSSSLSRRRNGTDRTEPDADDGAGGSPSSGQGPARPPQPSRRPKATVAERRQSLSPEQAEQLDVLERLKGGDGPGSHELITMAEGLTGIGWSTKQTTALILEAQQRGGRWRRKAWDVLCDPERRDAWQHQHREAKTAEHRLDHHFDAEIDQRIREEAAADCADLGMDLERCYELMIAERYRQMVNYRDRQLEQVPARYRKHLASDPKLSVAPRAVARREREAAEAEAQA